MRCPAISRKNLKPLHAAAAFCVVLVAVVLVAGCIGGDNLGEWIDWLLTAIPIIPGTIFSG